MYRIEQTRKAIYSKRGLEPEFVFGNIKQNKGFKRFTLTTLTKVNIKFGLIAIAHNFSKWIAKVRLQNFRPDLGFTNELKNPVDQFLMMNCKYLIKFQ